MNQSYEARLVVRKTDGSEAEVPIEDTDGGNSGVRSASDKWYKEICRRGILSAEFQYRLNGGEWIPVVEFRNNFNK